MLAGSTVMSTPLPYGDRNAEFLQDSSSDFWHPEGSTNSTYDQRITGSAH